MLVDTADEADASLRVVTMLLADSGVAGEAADGGVRFDEVEDRAEGEEDEEEDEDEEGV
jgi:hypothetical protein